MRLHRHDNSHGVVGKAAGPEDYQGADDVIRAIAEKAEPKLRRALADALSKLRTGIDMDQLVDAVKMRDVERIMRLIPLDDASAALRSAFEHLIDAHQDAGAAAAAGSAVASSGAAPPAGGLIVVPPKTVDFLFDRLDPQIITELQTYRLDLIRQISDGTRETIRRILIDGLAAGQNPVETARQIDDVVGLTSNQAQSVRNYRQLLQNGDRGALDRELRDRRFDPTVERAASGQITLSQDQVDRMVERYQERFIAYRAKTIARTETLRATNSGAHAGYAQAIRDGKIPRQALQRRWLVALDERTCPICLSIIAMNPSGVGFDDDFMSIEGPIYAPPAHPNCRCTVAFRIDLVGAGLVGAA